MLPSNLLSTTDARKRINAIKQYTSLGSGFKIAMRDLEIRGAGNLLGTQQSGNVVAIGFDLYCQILKQAVHSIQGRPRSGRLDVTADVDFVALTEAEHRQNPHKLAAYVPTDYMEEAATRIAAYKQVAELTSMKELNDLEKNWQDRFGQIPMPATNLLRHAELKISAWHNGIQSVQIKDTKVMLQRKGKYLMIQEKFPRLNPKHSQPKRLLEAIEWVKKL
jgi:transcription-repair coupling factor (superfamily II helicase)